ncbi:M20/M25/M40 family metallo-hydrolase [Caldithrix abyssi]|nr:M20/M25/M40 family metallo-hydrolase [Caldithrix abyssi]
MKQILAVTLMYALPLCSRAQVVDNFKAHTEYLASDELGGRGTGSKHIRLAAEYIAGQFKSIGLQPIADQSYYQQLPIPGQSELAANVIGIIPAVSATNRSLVFTAHYDAYGIREIEGQEDTIYNGARDNAIGVAAIIEIARIFKTEKAPAQNLVFVATAAEESGMHGSRYYVEHPIYPLQKITICLNVDGFNVSGQREDYYVMPHQGVDFVDEIESISASMGWSDVSRDKGDYMNKVFDTASFLAKGIPAFTLWTGDRLKGGKTAAPIEFGKIHTPDDEVNKNWNWDGVEDHIALYKAIADYFLNHPDGISVTDPTLFQ